MSTGRTRSPVFVEISNASPQKESCPRSSPNQFAGRHTQQSCWGTNRTLRVAFLQGHRKTRSQSMATQTASQQENQILARPSLFSYGAVFPQKLSGASTIDRRVLVQRRTLQSSRTACIKQTSPIPLWKYGRSFSHSFAGGNK